jgi:hypothetical protein
VTQARNPITVVLDGVRQNYNIGGIFRLCHAFLVKRLVICGVPALLHKRKLIQAAAGTQRSGALGAGEGRGGEESRALDYGRRAYSKQCEPGRVESAVPGRAGSRRGVVGDIR